MQLAKNSITSPTCMLSMSTGYKEHIQKYHKITPLALSIMSDCIASRGNEIQTSLVPSLSAPVFTSLAVFRCFFGIASDIKTGVERLGTRLDMNCLRHHKDKISYM